MTQQLTGLNLEGLSLEQKRQLAAQLLQKKSSQGFAVSSAQQRLWFLAQIQPSNAYVLPAVLRLTGRLEKDRLKQCLNQILQRHQVLRTRYYLDKEQVKQQVMAAEFDWTLMPPQDLQESIYLISQPFDLTQAPLLRGQLLQISETEHYLLLAVHHIAADYRSLRILLQEMVQIYQHNSLPALPIQYTDYALWQSQQIDRHSQQLSYWQQQLKNAPQGLPIFPDFSSRQPGNSGAVETFALSAQLSEQLRQLSRQAQATLFMTLLAAFNVLLYRYSGQSDLLVGSTVEQRHRPELRSLIGLFVNNLVFRTQVNPQDSYQALLQQVKQVCTDAYENADLPYEKLVENLRLDRSTGQNPLFQIMFVLHSGEDSLNTIDLNDLTLEYLPSPPQSSRFDLSLDMDDRPDGIVGRLEYRTDLFKPETIQQLLGHFQVILAAIAATPNQPICEIPLLAEESTMAQGNQTEQSSRFSNLVDGLQQSVARYPQHIAVQDNTASITYAELDRQANQLAHYLTQQGVKPGDRLGIALGRSLPLVIALLAVLKVRGTYVPIDRSYPADRISYIVSDAQLSYMIVDGDLEETVNTPTINLTTAQAEIAAEPSTFETDIQPEDRAYLIYTSGSTGQPKGVQISHRSLANILSDLSQKFGLEESDRWLAVTTIAFDIAALELFLPLMVGARVCIAAQQQNAKELVRWLTEENITIMQATPATWRMLLECDWAGGLQILSGGEALETSLAKALLGKSRRLWNLYGPTETTIWSAVYAVQPKDCEKPGFIQLGNPIANTQFYILDEHQNPVPYGVPGQLYIGGAGLSQGYWQRSDLNAVGFINHGGQRLYRTGDRVRRSREGQLEYLGRLDFQIKLRGYRIELGEIEASMMAVVGVSHAAVVLSGQRLVGFYQALASADASLEERIRAQLESSLPSYMLPSQLAAIVMPMTPNGKIDRLELRQQNISRPKPAALPKTETERHLAEIWSALLGIEQIEATDDFFSIGGHSLLAMRLVSQVQTIFQVALPLDQIFRQPQLAQVARAIESEQSTEDSLTPTDGPIQLSLAQRRFWLLNQLEPDSAAYHIPIVLRLTGDLDPEKLRHSFEQIIERHAVLRTLYLGVEPQAAVDDFNPERFDFEVIDGAAIGARETNSLIAKTIGQAFDLSTVYPIRVSLIIAPQQKILTIVLHHIAADATSVNLLLSQVAQIYQGVSLPPLAVQYADFAAWQQQPAQVEARSQQLAYWKTQLFNAPAQLEFPTDRPRTVTDAPPTAAIKRFSLSSDLTQINQYCKQEGITLFMLLLAAYGWVLSRYSGDPEVIIGSPIAHRKHSQLDAVIGCFTNTLVLRVDGQNSSTTVRELLQQVKAMTIAAYTHQDLPFEQLVEALQPERSARHPLCQTMLVLQNAAPILTRPSFHWEIIDLEETIAKFDLLLTFTETETGLAGRLDYDTAIFESITIDRLVQTLEETITQMLAFPERPMDQLTCLALHQQQIDQWNSTARSYPIQPLHQMVEVQAIKTPNQIALIDGDRQITYKELNQRANQFAHHLQLTGRLKPGSRIGILLDRRAETVMTMLAVLKLGCAYVSIDRSYPEARINYLIQDAELSCLIIQESGQIDWNGWTIQLEEMGRSAQISNLETPVQLEDIAYLIYTSGSTGQPKGVVISHRNVSSFIHWAMETFEAEVLQGVLASTSFCFDLSIFEIFLPLSSGGAVILAENALLISDLDYADRITLINTVPSIMQALLSNGSIESLPALQVVNLAGEALSGKLVQQLYQKVQRVYNLYGPSEDTTYSTWGLMPLDAGDQRTPSIGQPIANSQVHILDSERRTLPIGAIGELYLTGDGVAQGYFGKSAISAETFFESEGKSWYRTGDRARWRFDGKLEYLGRLDDQIKLRGLRIELGEIEACLEAHPEVCQAVVVVQETKLIGCYVAGHAPIPAQSLQQRMAQQLPGHMIPTQLIAFESFPLTPNGKLDRRAIGLKVSEYIANLEPPSAGLDQPRDAIEQKILALWKKYLPDIGTQDNFFEFGGDSIMAIQLVSAARQQNLHFTPRQLFQFPTVCQLADWLRSSPAASLTYREISQAAINGRIDLAPIQHWFFEQDLVQAHHWNQSLLLTVPEAIEAPRLQEVMASIIEHHDVLRSRFEKNSGIWQQTIVPFEDLSPAIATWVQTYDLSGEAEAGEAITALSTRLQSSFNLAEAPLLRVAAVNLGPDRGHRLLFISHHLIIDGLSWRILLEDWQTAYQQYGQLPQKTDAYSAWTGHLSTISIDAARHYWGSQDWQTIAAIPIDHPLGSNQNQDLTVTSVQLSPNQTQALLQSAPQAYQTQINDLLLTALALTLQDWTGQAKVAIELEGHGRDSLESIVNAPNLDLSRTIGWFTSLFPVRFSLAQVNSLGDAIKCIKEQLRRVPDQGISYGLLKYYHQNNSSIDLIPNQPIVATMAGPLNPPILGDFETDLARKSPSIGGLGGGPDLKPSIRFNYLGQTAATLEGQGFQLAPESTGISRAGGGSRDIAIEINAIILNGQLKIDWTYSRAQYRSSTLEKLAQSYLGHLQKIIQHCLNPDSGGHTPSDFPDMDFNQDELDDLLDSL